MRKRGTDLLIFMLLAACGGADNSTATAETTDSRGNRAHGGIDHLPGSVCRRGRGAAPRQRDAARNRVLRHGPRLHVSARGAAADPVRRQLGDRELRADRGLHRLAVRRRIRNDGSSRRVRSGAHHAGHHSGDQARAEPGHDRDVGDRSRARDGSRQDTDGRLQQRHAGIRRVQHRQAAGLHEGCGVQQRPGVRHDAGLFRQPVLAAGERHHRLSGRHAGLHQRHDVRCGEQARAVERAVHGPDEPAAQRAGVEPAERDRHPGTDRGAR